jgi:hypothetical protein
MFQKFGFLFASLASLAPLNKLKIILFARLLLHFKEEGITRKKEFKFISPRKRKREKSFTRVLKIIF